MAKYTITVSDSVKRIVEAKAKLVCETLKLPLDEFNQDCNALAALMALKEIGLDIPADYRDSALMVLKKAGNASALRQKITETEKEDKSGVKLDDAMAELLGE